MSIPLEYKQSSCMVRATVAYTGKFELIKSLEVIRQQQIASEIPVLEMQNLMKLLEYAGSQVVLTHALLQSTSELIDICDKSKLVFVGLPLVGGYTSHVHFIDRYQVPNRFGNQLDWVPEEHFMELTKFARTRFSAFIG